MPSLFHVRSTHGSIGVACPWKPSILRTSAGVSFGLPRALAVDLARANSTQSL